MTRSRSDTSTRSEVTDTIDNHRSEMDDQAEVIEERVEDLEIEHQTLAELEGGGTSEGVDAAEACIEQARETSGGEFDDESDVLSERQAETQEYGEELDDRSEVASADRERITTGRDQVHSDAAGNDLAAAEAAAQEDIEFLEESESIALEAREESERLHDEHMNRATSARSS